VEAFQLADQCLAAIGLDPQNLPPDWYGLPYDVQVLLERGCDRAIVCAAFAQFSGHDPPPRKKYVLKTAENAHFEHT
jgi:hypothetical protein